jgi:protein-S-isoprenylcysteine O-methyltransferase Ste14
LSERAIRRSAVALHVVYLALAFGGRSWQQRRTTGDWGFRLSRETQPVARVASGLITAGAVAGFAGAVAGPRSARPAPPTRVLGLAGMVAGVVGTLRAQLDLGASWRVGVAPEERTDLVTTGVFRSVRNPIFSCMTAIGVANAVAVPNPATVGGAALLATGISLQVRMVEEPYLRSVHGEAYASYVDSTGRFVPRTMPR